MEKIKNTASLTRAQAKSMFKKYATAIANILISKGIMMIKEDSNYNSCWLSSYDRNKKMCARADITVFYHNMDNEVAWVDLLTTIHYPDSLSNKTNLEVIIKRKWPLLNRIFSVSKKNPKMPILNPAKEVAEQFYLALKYIDKIK